jgi:hypothetical protein
MGRKMTNYDRDKCYTLSEKGLKAKEIGEILNWEKSTVSYIIRIGDLVKQGDIAGAEKIKKGHELVFDWACEKFNKKEIPQQDNTLTEVLTELREIKQLLKTLL